MKKVIILLLAALVCAAFAHPFAVKSAELLGNDQVEVSTVLGTGFVEGSDIAIENDLTYGAGERFNITISNLWTVNNVDEKDRGFGAPVIGTRFGLIPDVLAIDAHSAINGGTWGGDLIYTLALESETKFNFNAGFASNLFGGDAFTYGFAFIQPISSMLIGAEILGYVFDGMSDAELGGEYTFWNFGLGYNLSDTKTLSLGLSGDFDSNSALTLSLGFTFVLGGN
jgi:hypothetical protein